MAVYPIPQQAEQNWGDWRQMLMNALETIMPGTRPQMPQGAPPTPPSLPELIARMTMEQTPQAALGSGMMGMGTMPLITKQGTKWINNSKKIFGTTNNINEAGYILPEGTLLDFSGKNFGGEGGYRVIDHRDIWQAMGSRGGGSEGMIKFMNNADAIRMHSTYHPKGNDIYLDIPKMPTKQQINTLSKYHKYYDEIIVDISNKKGDIISSKDFSGRSKMTDFIDFLNRIFKNE